MAKWEDTEILIIISGSTLSGCLQSTVHGVYLATAGHRIDPSRESTFVWRVKSTDTHNDTVYEMQYTNWRPGQPGHSSDQALCVDLFSAQSYVWNAYTCTTAICSVCELDI